MKYPVSAALSFFLIFYCNSGKGQQPDFLPGTPDLASIGRLSETCKQRYAEEVKALPSKNRKDYLELYEHRWTSIKERFDSHELCTEAAASAYMDRLVAEILRGNPSLKPLNFNCYFSREAIPNASYIGEGVILFNMGLFSRLRSESEGAFVLCHEIGHCLLRHSENGIANYVAMINSEEVQKALHKIKGSEYGKREQLDKMVKGLTFDSRRHSRDHESQADSMAVELMRHTRFAADGALSALALLDKIDTDSLHTADCLSRLFNAPEYPFQKKWVAWDGGLLGGHAKIADEDMADSLKTHPDCQTRIKTLTPYVLHANQGGAAAAFVIDSAQFRVLQERFRYEAIEFAFESKRYTRCLFLALQAIGKKPEDPYLVASIGRVMNGLYAAQKAHTLSSVVSLPSPDYPANYNLLLQFVQNLYLENITGINYYFLKGYHPKMDHYTLFKDAFAQSEKNFQLSN